MIISASRRTDIPAFYSEWFINRIKEGFFIRTNPYNPKQQKTISLLKNDVDAIVFWTKNPSPLIPDLPLLDQMGYAYYFLFTLNNYSQVFEPYVPSLLNRIDTFQKLSVMLGSQRVIWRYDPIIISNQTSIEYHLKNFRYLSEKLCGYTERVIISFLDLYPKVQKRLTQIDTENKLEIMDCDQEENQEQLKILGAGLSEIARENGIELFSCAEKLEFLQLYTKPSSCIDVTLINQIFNLKLTPKKDPSQRPECLCAASIDMGMYDTCLFACSYCYACRSNQVVNRNMLLHNPKSALLIG